MDINKNSTEVAVFGGGCFWCTEAVFRQLRGVVSVMPGYTGGNVKKPTYEQVSGGTTGHAEVSWIEFNPKEISYRDLLEVFFATHDPTSYNRQGDDVGSQYRSEIFYANPEQKKAAADFIARLNDEKAFSAPIVTKLSPLGEFYEAEDYHQKYFEKNPDKLYCRLVINPKLDKLRKHFQALIKT